MHRLQRGRHPRDSVQLMLKANRSVPLACLAVLLCAPAVAAPAAELQQKTISAFNHYVEVSEARMKNEIADPNHFLLLQNVSDARRQKLEEELQQGRVMVEKLKTREGDEDIHVPGGLVHHWVAMVFVPGCHLRDALALLQDYDHHQNLYKPDVQRSKLLSADHGVYRVYLRFYRKTIVTAVYNAEFENRYFPVDATHEYSESRSTRIAEVEDPGKPSEHEKPVGNDRGYLWRLNTYWRYEETPQGVYLQIEFIALSRSVPFIFAWLVNPYITSVPRDYLTHLLTTTRRALLSGEQMRSNEPAFSRFPAAPAAAPRRLPPLPSAGTSFGLR